MVALVLVAAVVALLSLWWTSRPSARQTESPTTTTGLQLSAAAARNYYVGRAACATCHAKEDQMWQGSHHDLAMQEVNASTVLGDFADRKIAYNGIESRFFQRGGQFFVNTDGPDGKLADYAIKYTFGVWPLQQYLIEFPGGRLQALSIAWDARSKDEGGQRWFHLYPHERIDHKDSLHWTGQYQNWNLQCAACHSTNLKKGYEPANNSYKTSFSELNVSCEACHGPGSGHVDWASRAKAPYRSGDDKRPAMHGAQRWTKPASRERRSQTRIAWPPLPSRSITPMANSAMRSMCGARSCRAACTRKGSPAWTATMHIRPGCVQKAMPCVCAATAPPASIPRSTISTSPALQARSASDATCPSKTTWWSTPVATTAYGCPARICQRSLAVRTPALCAIRARIPRGPRPPWTSGMAKPGASAPTTA
jgi:hypothetical protein